MGGYRHCQGAPQWYMSSSYWFTELLCVVQLHWCTHYYALFIIFALCSSVHPQRGKWLRFPIQDVWKSGFLPSSQGPPQIQLSRHMEHCSYQPIWTPSLSAKIVKGSSCSQLGYHRNPLSRSSPITTLRISTLSEETAGSSCTQSRNSAPFSNQEPSQWKNSAGLLLSCLSVSLIN